MSDRQKTGRSEFDDVLKNQEKLQRRERLKADLPLYLMMLPGIIYLICKNYLPTVSSRPSVLK